MPEIKPSDYILVVEDSEADFFRIERAIKKSIIQNPLIHIDHGDDARDYLLRTGKHADDPSVVTPSLILLDINLPGMNGIEILKIIKKTDGVKRIPVIVMTTSQEEKDIEECYDYGANSYIVKPFSNKGFLEAMDRIGKYWFSAVELAKPNSGKE